MKTIGTTIALLGAVVCAAAELKQEDISFSSSLDAQTGLLSTFVYPADAKKLPVMILQPGYNGGKQKNLYSAQRMARRGYFCVVNERRGLGGSKGAHDDGGVEIMDIHDSLQEALKRHPDKTDADKVSIVGYSNGGANVFSAVVRFPYQFRAAMALFGIPSYAHWVSFKDNGFKGMVFKAVGGTPEQVPDKYLARDTTKATGNLKSGTRFHIAYDEAETLCPPAMDEAFVEAAKQAGVPNLFVHVSKKGEQHRWLHGYNTKDQLSPIEDIFLDDIAANCAKNPEMPAKGELAVLGFVATPRFTCVLGKGDDAAAKLSYEFDGDTARFTFSPLSSNPKATAKVAVHGWNTTGNVAKNITGQEPATVKKGEPLEFTCGLGETVTLKRGN